MIRYLQLPYCFDVLQMQKEVQLSAQKVWPLHFQKKHYEGEWSALALRSMDGTADNIFISPEENKDYLDTPLLEQSPYLKKVLETFRCHLLSVRLLKLSAGAVIKEHTDADLRIEKGLVRFHIPVVTNDQVEFYLMGERIHMKEGECWYLNLTLPHSIKNKSTIDRIHLVIDAVPNDWVMEQFNSNKVLHKQEINEEEQFDKNTKLEMIFHFRKMNTAISNKMADDLEASMK